MWLVLFISNRLYGACPEVGVFGGDFAPSAWPRLDLTSVAILWKECCARNNISRLCDVIRPRAEQGPTMTLFFCSVYFLLFQSIFQIGASFAHIPVLSKNWLMFERIPTYLQRNSKVVPPIICQSPLHIWVFCHKCTAFCRHVFHKKMLQKESCDTMTSNQQEVNHVGLSGGTWAKFGLFSQLVFE